MEIDGHPSQDLIEELERRGAVRADGGAGGPLPDSLRFVSERAGGKGGYWLFVPTDVFMTGVDEVPGS